MHWFDTREGKLIVGDAAYESVIEQSGPGDIVPLGELITSDSFTIDYSHFDKHPPIYKVLDKEEYRIYGKWVINIIRNSGYQERIKRIHFERLSALGIGMAYGAMQRGLDKNFETILQELDTPQFSAPGTYDNWTEDDFVSNAKKLAAILRRKPTKEDYRQWAYDGNGPGPRVIFENLPGGYRRLNDLIGYPDIHNWEKPDYVDWGVHVMRANDGQVPTLLMLEILSAKKRGPSPTIVTRKFAGFSNFQREVEKEYHESFGHDASITDPVSIRDAMRQLVDYCLPKLAVSERMTLVKNSTPKTIIDAIIRKDKTVSRAHIETGALTIGIDDILWPAATGYEYLRVSEEEIKAARQKSAARRKRARSA